MLVLDRRVREENSIYRETGGECVVVAPTDCRSRPKAAKGKPNR